MAVKLCWLDVCRLILASLRGRKLSYYEELYLERARRERPEAYEREVVFFAARA
ncbi:MAG TPA: hypothetical protein VFA98_07540 [Thermoanaerobaculia bacterium]|nr:hypothetical protein [Thermoanaerobaculia bacterium]